MDRSAKTWIGRVARQAMTVGVLALVLSTLAVSPAGANQRGDAVTAANDFIYGCTANGGDVVGVGSKVEFVVVVCLHENGSSQQCSWDASNDWERTCWWDHPELRSPDGDGPGVDPGDTINPGRAASSADAEDGKHAKDKGKSNGKKHGKAKRHGKGGRK